MGDLLKSKRWECDLLGCLMLEADTLADMQGAGLTAADFTCPRRGRLFSWLAARIDARKPSDMISVVESIALRSDRADFPSLSDVSGYSDDCSPILAAHNAGELVGLSYRRNALQELTALVEAYRQETEPDGLQARAEQVLSGLARGTGSASTWTDGDDLARLLYDDLRARQTAHRDGRPLGVAWGIRALDRRERDPDTGRSAPVLPAMEKGRLYLMPARPAMGKSSLACQVLLSAAQRGESVGVYNLEMESDGIGRKLLSLLSGVPTAVMRDGSMTGDEWSRTRSALSELSTLPIHLDTKPAQSIEMIASKARRLAARLEREGKPLRLLVVDYAQLIRSEGRSTEERQSGVSQGLLALAKELQIPVLALAQLNRDCEKRADKRPQLSDLRGSGQWEQDAHAILFVYRDAYYNPLCGHNTTELIIAKFRDHHTTTLYLKFTPETQRFTEA